MILAAKSEVTTLDLIIGLILAVLVLGNMFSLRTAESVQLEQARPTFNIEQLREE